MKTKPGLKEETALTYCVAESNREEQRLTPWLTCLFSLTAALAVANVYFAQPLLESMATSLSVQSATVGLVVTLTQIGYAVGLLFIVPLGDLVNRKYLVITQLLLLATALAVAGLSQRWFMFLGAMALVGMMAVVVQIVVACTTALAAPAGRGKA
ncbi:MFS transporter, partial [Escherichia coli]|nr:MFS transporter [Escherichia coli]